jgi:hypothetical protein
MDAHQSATYCPRPAEMRYRHFLGSSGRRFKLPRSPRLGCAWRIQFRNASGRRSTARPAGESRAWDPTPDTTAPRAQATRRDTCYSLPAKLPSSVYKIKPASEVSEKTGEPHTAHSCGVLGTPTTIVSTRLTLFLACQGGKRGTAAFCAARVCATTQQTSIKAARGPRTGTPCADVTESRCDSGVFWPRPLQDRGANFSYSSAR